MHSSEGTNDGASAGHGNQVGDHGERLLFRSAVRLDQRAGGGAEPRAANGIGDERKHRLFEIAIGLHLHGRVVGEERVGDLPEILHVGTEDDRLAEHGRLENIVAAVVHEAAADEDGGGELIELRQLADRVEHDDVGARLDVDGQLAAAARRKPLVAGEPLDLGESIRLAGRDNRERARRIVDPPCYLEQTGAIEPDRPAGRKPFRARPPD